MDTRSMIETRWQDGEFLSAVELLHENGQPTPLIQEVGAQILRGRGEDIRSIGRQLLYRARVRLHLVKLDDAKLIEVSERLQAAGHLKVEREAKLLGMMDGRPAGYFVRMARPEPVAD